MKDNKSIFSLPVDDTPIYTNSCEVIVITELIEQRRLLVKSILKSNAELDDYHKKIYTYNKQIDKIDGMIISIFTEIKY